MSYRAIASTTLTSAQATVIFSSIPATFRDLIVVFNGQLSTNGSLVAVLNNDGTSIYSFVSMEGNGSSATSGANASFTAAALAGRSAQISSSERILAIAQIMDYSATDKHKTILARGNSAGQLVEAIASRYASTSAINQVQISQTSGNLASGSTVTLYGVSA